MENYKGAAIVGSKTGVYRRPVMSLEGADGEVSRTGIIKRKDKHFERGDGEERREPPIPTTLPEITKDDGGTTGIVHLNTEGSDRAKRENHPRRAT